MKKKILIICIPILILALSAAIFFTLRSAKNKPAVICDGTKKAAVSPTNTSSNNGPSTNNNPSTPQETVKNTIGNTSGNLANGGYAAEQGDWVYYSLDGIYKVMPDMETGLQKLCSDEAYCLNVVGDWIYYIDRITGYLYKIKTNGQDKTLVVDYYCSYYVIKDNHIYYWTGYIDLTKSCHLYKINISDDKRTYLSDIDSSSIPFTFDDNYMYWLSADAASILTRTDYDGKNKLQLTTTLEFPPIASDGWIYYLDENLSMWRINTTGSTKEKLCSDCSLFNIKGDYIYYADTQYNLCKMKKDGSDKTKYNINIAKLQMPNHLILTKDYILIFDDHYDTCLKIKYDGSVQQMILN